MATEKSTSYSKPPPRWLMKALTKLNVWIFRLSDGRLMNRFAGREICLVKMKGASSGKVRYIPLMYVPYKDGVLLVASQGGAPKHPVWYHNLITYPNIEVQVERKTFAVKARQASSEEKKELWPTCVEYYPPYDDYQAITSRDIPVFICLPE